MDNIIEKWSFCNKESIDYNVSKKITTIENPDFELKFKVRKYDTDMNKHVNNIRYLEWVLESIPDEIVDNYYLHSIEGNFIAEALYGQTVISMTKNCQETNLFMHTIKIEGTDKICATAKTIWKQKCDAVIQ